MPLSSNRLAVGSTTPDRVNRRANRRLALLLGAVAVAWFLTFVWLTVSSA